MAAPLPGGRKEGAGLKVMAELVESSLDCRPPSRGPRPGACDADQVVHLPVSSGLRVRACPAGGGGGARPGGAGMSGGGSWLHRPPPPSPQQRQARTRCLSAWGAVVSPLSS